MGQPFRKAPSGEAFDSAADIPFPDRINNALRNITLRPRYRHLGRKKDGGKSRLVGKEGQKKNTKKSERKNKAKNSAPDVASEAARRKKSFFSTINEKAVDSKQQWKCQMRLVLVVVTTKVTMVASGICTTF